MMMVCWRPILEGTKIQKSPDSLVKDGKVYDISSFAEEHPGGEPIILDQAGGDASEAFRDVGHSDDARKILQGLLVGNLRRTTGDSQPSSYTTQKKAPVDISSTSKLGGPLFVLMAVAVVGIMVARKYLGSEEAL